ncbi:MAG: hypothetical protein H7343_16490 [Undibacterium sp.]|nr:hypothetical protein [Opitutaceae bacterium]
MKSPAKIIFAAALVGSALAHAGPSPQFWNVPVLKTTASAEVTRIAVPADQSGLTCNRMFVPRSGAVKQAPRSMVTCTPGYDENRLAVPASMRRCR